MIEQRIVTETEDNMKIGEVCLLTNNVPRLASFYRQLLGVEGSGNDETHQFVLAGETALTVYNDGTDKNNRNQNICLAFTVDDIDKAYKKCCLSAQESSNRQ